MLKPEEINAERERIRAAVSKARANVEDAMDSGFWSYTREYQLGKLDTAKKILEEVEGDMAPVELDPAEPFAPVTPSQIIEAAANAYNFTVPMLAGRSRGKRVVEARQIAMYLIRQDTNRTLAQIGEELGGRCPATICVAYAKIANQRLYDSVLRVEIRSIQEKLLEMAVICKRRRHDSEVTLLVTRAQDRL